MGFIDYKGTKEDRFDEVIDYAHAQQEEDWKRKQEDRIRKWLLDLTGDGSMAELYIQDLLKMVILKYTDLRSLENELTGEGIESENLHADHLWIDFSVALINRHIEPFHMDQIQGEKHFEIFLSKIFKIHGIGNIDILYHNRSDVSEYARFLVECFDPAWKDQEYYKYLSDLCGKDKPKREKYKEFLSIYRQLGLVMALYLYQAVQPRDNGWMLQESAEWNALTELDGKVNRKTLAACDYRKLRNLHQTKIAPVGDSKNRSPSNNTDNGIISNLTQQSKLRKKEFDDCISEGNILSYVNACTLLLECDLPDDIRLLYEQLMVRMPVLQDSVDKFDKIYHADIDQFNEYFAPETLKLTAVYLDYQAAQPSENVICETREGVLIAAKKLLQVVNEKIDEIYRFVTIEANAEAKALEAIISQDGYIDPNLRISRNGGTQNGKHE